MSLSSFYNPYILVKKLKNIYQTHSRTTNIPLQTVMYASLYVTELNLLEFSTQINKTSYSYWTGYLSTDVSMNRL
jgi:hypothetical protein